MRIQTFRASGSVGATVSASVPFLITGRTSWWCSLCSVWSYSVIMIWAFPAIDVVLSRIRKAHICSIIKCYLCILRSLVALIASWYQIRANFTSPFSKIEAICTRAGPIPVYLHIWGISIAFTLSILWIYFEEFTCAFSTLIRSGALSTSF